MISFIVIFKSPCLKSINYMLFSLITFLSINSFSKFMLDVSIKMSSSLDISTYVSESCQE